MVEFRTEGESVFFWLRVKPRSSHERLGLDASGQLTLELHAAPREGQANEACIHFLARSLRLPEACIVILSGRRSRRKLIRVTGHTPEDTIARLKRLVSRGDA